MKLHAILAMMLAAGILPAQLPFKEEKVGDFQTSRIPGVPSVNIRGGFVGIPLKIDAEFTSKHENKPPTAPFKILLPRMENLFVQPGGKMAGIPELVKISTATADKRVIEILRLTQLKVARQSSPADRLKACAQLLQNQAFEAVARGYKKGEIFEVYSTKIGMNDAVCLHAHMESLQSGDKYALKLVGILDSNSDGGVFAFLMADTELSDIKRPADLGSKGTGLAIIHSVEFMEVQNP